MPTTTAPADLRQLRKTLRETRDALAALTDQVLAHLAALDATMHGPSTEHRGREIAAHANALDLANDQALRYGLGRSLDQINRRKALAVKQHLLAQRRTPSPHPWRCPMSDAHSVPRVPCPYPCGRSRVATAAVCCAACRAYHRHQQRVGAQRLVTQGGRPVPLTHTPACDQRQALPEGSA